MKYFEKITILLMAMGSCGCVNFGLGENLLSSRLELRPAPDGFVATQRAGVDRLANEPTWETIRSQSLLSAVREAGYCPGGIASIERKTTDIASIEIGTSRDLVYLGRCKAEAAPATPAGKSGVL